jgi:hypothetical protein
VTTFKICAYDEVLVKLREFSDKALENDDEEEGATLRR